MRQCPDCEEKDRVVIAGKVFCANCGTPWETADKQESDAYLQKVGLAEPPKEEAPVAPAPATPANMPAPPNQAAGAPPQSVSSVPTPTPTPTPTPSPSPSPQPSVTQTPPPNPVSQQSAASGVVSDPQIAQTLPPAPMQVPASVVTTPVAPVESPVQPGAPSATVPVSMPSAAPVSVSNAAPALPPQPTPSPAPTVQAPMPVVAQAPTSPAQPLASTPTPPVSMPASVAPAEYKEQVASEIPSLDSKDEAVLSDSQLQAMSQTTAPVVEPVSVPTVLPTQQGKSMVDIAPRAVLQVDTIAAPTALPTSPVATSPAPIATAPQPSVQPAATAAPASVAPEAPKITPVMSRDDALKLALGDTAPAIAQPAATPGVARPLALVMSVMAFVMLGAYLWQSNYPAFALKLASVRSGVEAAAPAYLPSGWVVTRDVTSGDGSLIYKLQNQDKAMIVSQQKTEWDSQALLEQYILVKSQDYLALQAQGLTIYIYGNNQAAWVNHGIMYKIEGDHGLDQDQIIRVATSL